MTSRFDPKQQCADDFDEHIVKKRNKDFNLSSAQNGCHGLSAGTVKDSCISLHTIAPLRPITDGVIDL